jgi:hypothetical protein
LGLIVQNANHNHMSARSMKEMGNLATMLDLLTARKFAACADHIVQRFKASGRNAIDGHWDIASQLEVRSAPDHGLAGTDELYEAGRMRLAADRLDTVVARPKNLLRPRAGG